MNLLSGIRWKLRRFAPVRLTRMEVVYRGCFALRVLDADHLELAWSTKTETARTERGQVWSQTEIPGPGIDRVLIDAASAPTEPVTDLVIDYPVVLGEQRGTLRTTGPGVIRSVVLKGPEPTQAPESTGAPASSEAQGH
jgi:hypothetical protein